MSQEVLKLTKEELIEEGQALGQQIDEWLDIFELMIKTRKAGLVEVEQFCVLSNRFKVERILQAKKCKCAKGIYHIQSNGKCAICKGVLNLN